MCRVLDLTANRLANKMLCELAFAIRLPRPVKQSVERCNHLQSRQSRFAHAEIHLASSKALRQRCAKLWAYTSVLDLCMRKLKSQLSLG